MPLISCQKCKQAISDKSTACPHCGFIRKKKGIGIGAIIFLCALGYFGYHFYLGYSGYTKKSTNQQTHSGTQQGLSTCNTSHIDTKINTFSFEDHCTQSTCFYMQGAAEITNNCPYPVGVQLKIIGYDSQNSPISSKNFWPESTLNLPVGVTAISLDQALDYDSRIETISIHPTKTKVW